MTGGSSLLQSVPRDATWVGQSANLGGEVRQSANLGGEVRNLGGEVRGRGSPGSRQSGSRTSCRGEPIVSPIMPVRSVTHHPACTDSRPVLSGRRLERARRPENSHEHDGLAPPVGLAERLGRPWALPEPRGRGGQSLSRRWRGLRKWLRPRWPGAGRRGHRRRRRRAARLPRGRGCLRPVTCSFDRSRATRCRGRDTAGHRPWRGPGLARGFVGRVGRSAPAQDPHQEHGDHEDEQQKLLEGKVLHFLPRPGSSGAPMDCRMSVSACRLRSRK